MLGQFSWRTNGQIRDFGFTTDLHVIKVNQVKYIYLSDLSQWTLPRDYLYGWCNEERCSDWGRWIPCKCPKGVLLHYRSNSVGVLFTLGLLNSFKFPILDKRSIRPSVAIPTSHQIGKTADSHSFFGLIYLFNPFVHSSFLQRSFLSIDTRQGQYLQKLLDKRIGLRSRPQARRLLIFRFRWGLKTRTQIEDGSFVSRAELCLFPWTSDGFLTTSDARQRYIPLLVTFPLVS